MEALKSMQVDDDVLPLENGDSGHEVYSAFDFKTFLQEQIVSRGS